MIRIIALELVDIMFKDFQLNRQLTGVDLKPIIEKMIMITNMPDATLQFLKTTQKTRVKILLNLLGGMKKNGIISLLKEDWVRPRHVIAIM